MTHHETELTISNTNLSIFNGDKSSDDFSGNLLPTNEFTGNSAVRSDIINLNSRYIFITTLWIHSIPLQKSDLEPLSL